MQPEIVAYKGWEKCLRLSNGLVDLIITTQVGPRIMRFGFVGEANEFAEFPDQVGQTGGQEWRIYGGHRLWHSPETKSRTYSPDNFPITVESADDFVSAIQPVELATGIEKEMRIHLDEQKAHVRVTHRLRNTGVWPVELSPWAMSVMAAGGVAIIPLPPRASHSENLSPVNTLTLWAYTNLSDPRWTFGTRFILLNQDGRSTAPQKIGASVPDGWTAYARNGHLFLKQVSYLPGTVYPDGGSSVEVFTDASMTEMETLGPLTRLEPGAVVEHVETWDLINNIPQPANEEDVAEHVLPAIRPMLGEQV